MEPVFLLYAGSCGVTALQLCSIKLKDHEARAPCFKGEEMLTCDALFLPDTFQMGLSRARDQVGIVVQLHKEILLFQCWLKLLSPAERRISYTDGIACVAKTQQQEGQEMCYSQQHN